MLYIFPTIDVEGVHGRNPFAQMALGDIGLHENWGTLRLAELFQEHNVTATFFVDVYESSLYGGAIVQKLCQDIHECGQEVGLHTHPSWRDDPRDFKWLRKLKAANSFFPQEKDFLFKCSLEEQVEILRWGAEFIHSSTGHYPVSHRAGGYGANINTLKALKEVGVPMDSSMFTHSNCKLNLSLKNVSDVDGVFEIPITGFERNQQLHAGINFGIRRHNFFRTGLDDCSIDDLMWYVDQARSGGDSVMNLFMHSYSLLNFDESFTWFKPNFNNLKILQRFLSYVNRMPDVKILSMNDFYKNQLFTNNSWVSRQEDKSHPVQNIRSSLLEIGRKKMARTIKSRLNRLTAYLDFQA